MQINSHSYLMQISQMINNLISLNVLYLTLTLTGLNPHPNHSNYSYRNNYHNASMHNLSHADVSFASSMGVPTNPPMMQQCVQKSVTPSSMYSGHGATTSVNCASQSHSNAHSLPIVTPQSNHEEEFYLKDALRDFFAEGHNNS